MTDAATETAPTGREYLRVSLDRSGRARSVDEQHNDNARAAEDRGVALGEPYVDNSVSASRYSRKVRDGFADLLADLAAGRFGAPELWLWESSRGSRKVGEWVSLIEACEKAGVVIHVTTHGRTYDPSNGRDRRSLLEDAVDSEYESSKISSRAKRSHAANAAAGAPVGGVPYGYVRRYDERTRRLVAQEPHPEQAPIVREIFERLGQGHAVSAVSKDLIGRGVTTRTGTPFTRQRVLTIACNAAYAGLRVHDPNGRHGRERRFGSPDAQVTEGTWEALIDRETFYAVRARLADPKRTTTRPGAARHFLTGIGTCGVCGNVLAVTWRDGVPMYQCKLPGCVRIDKAGLDAVAEAYILSYLTAPENEPMWTPELGGEDLAAIRADIAQVAYELDELRDAVGSGALTVATLVRAEPAIVARLTALREQERELTTPPVLWGLVEPGEPVHTAWARMSMATRRDIARTVLTSTAAGTLAVLRRPRGTVGQVVPIDERVEWRQS
jgi:DNA invertase Pin-like site-specific DNA recombinase